MTRSRKYARFGIVVALGLGTTALTAVLAPSSARADECLLDTNNDGDADTNVDTDGGATSAGADALACGVAANAAASLSTAVGAQTNATALASTALGSQAIASGVASTALGHNSDATGLASTAVGVSAQATATGATAVGRIANASGLNATALGSGASATATNSVALGTGSVANQANTVSVGAVGAERRIVNVAAGTATTDAVNLGQLNSVSTSLGSSITALQTDTVTLFDVTDRLRGDVRDANEGVAMALAMDSPNVPAGAKFALSGGVGYFKNRAAFAAAISAAVGEMSSVSAGLGYGLDSNEIGARAGFQIAW